MTAAEGRRAPFLWVAFDGYSDDPVGTSELIDKLDQVPGRWGVKINGDALYNDGLEHFQDVLPPEKRKFGDIKMWNGARTMARTFFNFHLAGFHVVNVYALAGGYADDKGKGAELKRAITMFKDKVHGETSLKIYALTILSHYNDAYCMHHFGRRMDVLVSQLAEEGVEAGSDGIILPGTQLARVEHLDVVKMVTGLRTPWYKDNEQAQELHVEDVAGRADLEAVCGSPITKMKRQERKYLAKLLTELNK